MESHPRPGDGSTISGFTWRTDFTEDGRFWDVAGSLMRSRAPLRLVALDTTFSELGSAPLPPPETGPGSE